MTIAVANGIDCALSSIDMAMTVLDAAIEQACRAQGVKVENVHDQIWIGEIKYLNDLMTAACTLMKKPIEELEDIKDVAYQLHKEAQAQEAARKPKTYDIPPELAEVVRRIADKKGITTDEAAAMLVQAGLKAREGAENDS